MTVLPSASADDLSDELCYVHSFSAIKQISGRAAVSVPNGTWHRLVAFFTVLLYRGL